MYGCRFQRRAQRWVRTNHGLASPTQVSNEALVNLRLVSLLLGIFLLLQSAAAAQTKPIRRILVLNETGTSSPGINLIDQGIRTSFDNSPYKIEFYLEYMETTLFPDPADQRRFREFYLRKYANRRPDVIITVGPAPLRFMIEAHQRSFPGVPVVFCLPNNVVPGRPEVGSDFTGVEGAIEPLETLDAATRLNPATRRVVVVAGTSPFDKEMLLAVKERLRSYTGPLEFSYLTDLDMPTLLERLKHLSGQTIVLQLGVARDAAGTRFASGTESAPMIAAAATVPVFSLVDVFFNHGEVGGKIFSLAEDGKVAGGLALRILNGERPQEIPIVQGGSRYMFDWRALKRWGLKEKNLPPGSIVINRPLSVWEAYKWYIIAGISLFLLQTLLIVALLWHRKKRKRAEAVLRESEGRFRRVANSAPVFIWMAGPDQSCTYVNQQWLDFTGRKEEEEVGTGWADGIHTDDLENALATYSEAFHRRQPFTMEYRLRRHDGVYRWILDTGAPIVNPDGSFSGYIGSAIDVTGRKLAEEALASIGGRLIAAQEEERTRIARELQDDINQQMAFLAISLDETRLHPPDSAVEMRKRSETFLKQASDISKSIQALSHRLHSSKLEYFGLVNAMQGFSHEFSDQHHVEIRFSHEQVPDSVPREVSLCLFRVMQAALSNAMKHSGVKGFDVHLQGTLDGLHLTVHDDGVGFDPDKALKSDGIGIISMRERVRFVNGTLAIQSRLNGGTTIEVDVPLKDVMADSQTA